MSAVAPIEQDIALLAARDHHEPHRVLGAHPVDGGVAVRVWRPGADAVRIHPDDGDPVELAHRASGLFEAVVAGSRNLSRYEVEVELRRRRDARAGPVLVPADPRRARPAPGRRGQPSRALRAPRRPPRAIDGVAGVALRGLGANGARGQRRRRLERLGRARCTRCARSARRASGSCSCRASARARATSTRSSARTARSALKADPFALARRARRRRPASVVCATAPPVAGRRRGCARARATRRSPSRCRSTRCTSARGAANPPRATARSPTASSADELADYVSDMGFTHVELLPVMEHPFYGLLGLPGHRLLRADRRASARRTTSGVRRPPAPARHRRDPRLGARALPARRLRRSRASTARTSTSTPTRATARTPTGARSIFNYGRNEVRNFLIAQRASG